MYFSFYYCEKIAFRTFVCTFLNMYDVFMPWFGSRKKHTQATQFSSTYIWNHQTPEWRVYSETENMIEDELVFYFMMYSMHLILRVTFEWKDYGEMTLHLLNRNKTRHFKWLRMSDCSRGVYPNELLRLIRTECGLF